MASTESVGTPDNGIRDPDDSSPVRAPKEPVFGDDGRSSSLSEIEDGLVDENTQGASSIASGVQSENDSEAETERLEQSPVKPRSLKGAVPDADGNRNADGSPDHSTIRLARRESDPGLKDHAKASTSEEDGSLSAEVGDADADERLAPSEHPLELPAGTRSRVPSPPELAGQKRKRHGVDGEDGSGSDSDGREAGEPSPKRTGSIGSQANGEDAYNDITAEQDIAEDKMYDDTVSSHPERHTEDVSEAEQVVEHKEKPSFTVTASRTGHRKAAQRPSASKAADAPVPEPEKAQTEVPDGGGEGEPQHGNAETAADGDDDEDDADTPARNEEGMLKKRDAMNSLSMIEKQFATFRDKLFDERLAQLSNELTLLTQPTPTHPEYLAQLQCIDFRRQEKIHLEQTLYQYKLKTMQVNCVAARSQIHGQFYQTVRNIRETKLEEAGEQWYQIQRDRRGWEGTIPDFTHMFPKRRSTQIGHQTAHNREVSILSGVAKYVGFPAAPEMEGARPMEAEADLHRMGI